MRETAATRETFRTPALYVVATPLGNLADITLRALELLRAADAVACEDTRHARRLLDHYGIRAELFALHEHNESAAAQHLLALLREGRRVALISDAGTPAISDPGARAVAAVRAARYPVIPLPGANAAIAALSAAGVEATQFRFCGFLPARQSARRQALQALAPQDCPLVIYEAPHRIADTVADLAELFEGERELVIARELTKMFEEIAAMPLSEGPAWLAADENRRRGEFVLIVGAAPPSRAPSDEAHRVLRLLLGELPLKQAVALAADITGAPRNALYRLALEQKRQGL